LQRQRQALDSLFQSIRLAFDALRGRGKATAPQLKEYRGFQIGNETAVRVMYLQDVGEPQQVPISVPQRRGA
jgi:hypothetical protein